MVNRCIYFFKSIDKRFLLCDYIDIENATRGERNTVEYKDISVECIESDTTVEAENPTHINLIADFMKAPLGEVESIDVTPLKHGFYSLKSGEIAYYAAIRAGLKKVKVAVIHQELDQVLEVKEITLDSIIPNCHEPISSSEIWEQAVNDLSRLFIKLGGVVAPLILCEFDDSLEIASGEEIYYAAIQAGITELNCAVVSNTETIDQNFIESVFC